MKKITVLLLTTCLILTNFLTIGYTQEINLNQLQAPDVNADGVVNILDLTFINQLQASDVNADGVVNILDLIFIVKNIGTTPTADQLLNPDVNADGTVDTLDLTLVVNYFGKRSGIPFEVTDATFDDIVLGSELPIVVEFKDDN